MQDSDRALINWWEIAYSEGDKSLLLDALALCFEKRLPIPEWVREGLPAAIEQVASGKASSWDEVFGSAEARKTKGFRASIAFQVLKAIKDHGPGGIDFEAIAKTIRPPVSGSRAKQYYYDHYPESARRAIRPKSKKKVKPKSRP